MESEVHARVLFQPAWMAQFPDQYQALTRFPNWDEFTIRTVMGAALDHLWIEQFADALRSTPVLSHWVRDVPDQKDPDQFTVSVNIPNLGINTSTLLKVEDELEIVFIPKVDTSKIDPLTKEYMK